MSCPTQYRRLGPQPVVGDVGEWADQTDLHDRASSGTSVYAGSVDVNRSSTTSRLPHAVSFLHFGDLAVIDDELFGIQTLSLEGVLAALHPHLMNAVLANLKAINEHF